MKWPYINTIGYITNLCFPGSAPVPLHPQPAPEGSPSLHLSTQKTRNIFPVPLLGAEGEAIPLQQGSSPLSPDSAVSGEDPAEHGRSQR